MFLNAETDPYFALSHPPALIFGDDPGRRDRLVATLQERGFRVVAADAIDSSGSDEGAGRRLADQASIGLLVIDASSEGARDRLLDEARDAVLRANAPTLVIASMATIDVVASRFLDVGVPLLVDPSDAEVDNALDTILATSRSAVVADGTMEASNRRLAQLSEEVGRIARALASLSADGAGAAAPDVPAAQRHRDVAADLAALRAIIRMRRLRDQFLDPALFADPAWDMLLDLAAAEIEQRSVAVSSLCIAASVPATTALRWIATMTEHDLLVRRADPEDGRRVFVALSDRASAAMTAYLRAAAQVMQPAR